MSELGLIIFSVCMESSIGVITALTLFRSKKKEGTFKLAAAAAAGFVCLGMLASLLHLGRPLRAMNALFNVGSSWLSREIVLGGAFAACVVVYAAIELLKPSMKGLQTALGWAAVALGLVELAVMSNVYTSASVPAWDGINTYVEYYTSAVILGTIIFYAAAYPYQDERTKRAFGTLALAAVAVQLISAMAHGTELAGAGAPGVASAGILASHPALMALKWVFVLGGLWFFFWKGTAEVVGEHGAAKRVGSEMACFSALFVLAGLFISKYLFYIMLVTTGIGRV